MNCYKCNTGGYSPEELVRHEVDAHGCPEPIVTPMWIITTRDEVERRIAEAVAAHDEIIRAFMAAANSIRSDVRYKGLAHTPDLDKAREAEQLAQFFHETYERLAPSFGYKTREASAKPWADVPDQNKKLMIAVCSEVDRRIAEAFERTKVDERERAIQLMCGILLNVSICAEIAAAIRARGEVKP